MHEAFPFQQVVVHCFASNCVYCIHWPALDCPCETGSCALYLLYPVASFISTRPSVGSATISPTLMLGWIYQLLMILTPRPISILTFLSWASFFARVRSLTKWRKSISYSILEVYNPGGINIAFGNFE